MKKAEIFDFEKLTTSGEIDCACGQKHSTDMKILTVGRGVIEQLPDALRKLNVRRPMIVSGPFSFPAVGKKVCAVLDEADFVYSVFVPHLSVGLNITISLILLCPPCFRLEG